jgi:ABC-type Fe3+/spermidine/putrescine transport system ATPase subunit
MEPGAEHASALRVTELVKQYGQKIALDGVSFEVNEGEVVALLGPSGCGKSTLLHLIAGLEQADSGFIRWHGTDLADTPTHLRSFGLMFQEFALFPHLDVQGNIGFGLKMQGLGSEQIRERVSLAMELVDLKGFETRPVDTLSGGERQRVALARSLAPRPRLLMLDEPLGALDRTLRERLLLQLPEILGKLEQTVLYVTHDQEEAFAIADRVVLLNAGHVVQKGTPLDLYNNPQTAFAASFLGLTNIFPAEVRQSPGGMQVGTPFGTFPTETTQQGPVSILLRSDRLIPDARGPEILSGRVIDRSFRGQTMRLKVQSEAFELICSFDTDLITPEVGQEIKLSFDPARALQVLE